MLLKEVPLWDRPREKALKFGIKTLATNELIAILLNTGVKNESVIQLSNRVLQLINCLADLSEITITELKSINGIGDAKAITILAALELGLRVRRLDDATINFNDPSQIYHYLKDEVQILKQECLIALYLNTRGGLIAKRYLSRGTYNQTIIDGHEIFKWAYKYSSPAFVLVHNHPSGDPTPSGADLNATKKIIKQAQELNITFLDHIIIGKTYQSVFNFLNLIHPKTT